MIGFFRKFIGCEGGSSAVEFSLVAFPLILLLFGTIEFGRAYWTSHALQDVAVKSARCVAVGEPGCFKEGKFDEAATRIFVLEAARGMGIPLQPDDVVLLPETECSGLGGFSRVTLEHVFETPVAPLFKFMSGGLNLHGDACFPTQGA